MTATSAYRPFAPTRRPGGKPDKKPPFRVLVHNRQAALWRDLPSRVGVRSAQQFYDHVAHTPGEKPPINATTILRGSTGKPKAPGFSRTVHYEISGAGRIDFQYNSKFTGGAKGDPHGVVFILTIDLSSH